MQIVRGPGIDMNRGYERESTAAIRLMGYATAAGTLCSEPPSRCSHPLSEPRTAHVGL